MTRHATMPGKRRLKITAELQCLDYSLQGPPIAGHLDPEPDRLGDALRAKGYRFENITKEESRRARA